MKTPGKPAPRILPVVMVGLALFGLIKAGDLWVGFSSAGAEEGKAGSEEAPPPIERRGDDRILDQLAERRAELDRREAALETRDALLKATEARIEQKLAELDVREKAAAAGDAQQEAARDAQVSKLSDAYERMKPRDAARIFETMDADLLAPVAAGMRTQSLASVLGEMDAGKARELTALLANRPAEQAAAAP